ncbi:MAG: LOG family protein [Cyanobacteria bacterium J06633_2]
MVPFSSSSQAIDILKAEINELFTQLPQIPHGPLIQQALTTLVRMAEVEADRLDWKILNASLQDMENAFRVLYPFRHIRKVTIFGSARIPRETAEYQMAVEFAQKITQLGFMVMTGAGGGIMQAGNEGAGAENSFGLNIQLPFEQGANPYIEGDRKLINFKYFFTRKLFFLRETDALVLFPGGFGTQDEAFESLTLIQTGKSEPMPLILIDEPGRHYWDKWDAYIRESLLGAGLIGPNDLNIYTIVDNIDDACKAILNFYRVFHSSRYVGDQLVIRLNYELTDEDVEQLNASFSDMLTSGKIIKSEALAQETDSSVKHLPRLVLNFNQRDYGNLCRLIRAINQLGSAYPTGEEHPEQR